MALGASFLAKPILEALKRAAIKKAAETSAAKVAGLGVRELNKLSKLDVLNLVRAKAVKGAKAEVAKSLGISVQELNATLADLKLTEARKAAAKGANYIRNANRFIKDPVKTLKGQGKRIIARERDQLIKDAFDIAKDVFDEETEKSPSRLELEMLQDMLHDMAKGQDGDESKFDFSQDVWDAADNISIAHIQYIMGQIEKDQYYNYKGDDTVVWSTDTGGPGGGYKMGLEVEEWMAYVETLLLQGAHFTPHKQGEL